MTKILCIEDEPSLREVLVEELQDAGYDTVEAGDGAQGLEAIQREHPDLVISDIRMPRMDGHQLLKTLRDSHPEHADLPFVFLSAMGDRQAIIEGRRLGADAYLTKPVDYELLLVEVESRLTQVARMIRHKEEEMVRLYRAISTRREEQASPEAAAREAASAPKGSSLVPVFTLSGDACPMALCVQQQEPASGDTLAGDLRILRDADEIIRADLEAGLQRFVIIDIHCSTAHHDKSFEQWHAIHVAMPPDRQKQLGVRIVGLETSRLLALANGLVKRMALYSRAQFVEVDRDGLEILAGMSTTPRFVSIDAHTLAELARPIRQRARAYIDALHGKGAKVLLRSCATPHARRDNADLAPELCC